MRLQILTILLLSLLGAAPATAEPPGSEPATADRAAEKRRCAQIQVAAPGVEPALEAPGPQDSALASTAEDGSKARRRFSATEVVDLELEVQFPGNFAGDHQLHLKLLTPKGHHYQTLTVPIATDPAQVGSMRRLKGYPRPLPVRLVKPASTGDKSSPAVPVALPVAGTAIVSSSLYGRWTVEAYLDDDPAACSSVRFFLDP